MNREGEEYSSKRQVNQSTRRTHFELALGGHSGTSNCSQNDRQLLAHATRRLNLTTSSNNQQESEIRDYKPLFSQRSASCVAGCSLPSCTLPMTVILSIRPLYNRHTAHYEARQSSQCEAYGPTEHGGGCGATAARPACRLSVKPATATAAAETAKCRRSSPCS